MNVGREHHFPEPIIQHIQSFLTPKEAARTTVLSKSWGGAWLTRPNLEFDRSDFPRATERYEPDPLWKLADKTLKRYEVSNRKIVSFGIRTDEIRPHELLMIARAFKIGATRLTVQSQNNQGKYTTLPAEAVFGSLENLVALTVKGCAISHRLQEQDDFVRCPSIRSLCLDSVVIDNIRSIARIISSCPLIERLSLSNIYKGFHKNEDCHNVAIDVLPRLWSLVLQNVYFELDALFLSVDLSTTFPSLKDLTLSGHTQQKDVLISSPSLERLHFALTIVNRVPSVTFDVPNIRKLTYSGSLLPVLSFRSTPTALEETRVYVEHHQFLSASRYPRLVRFLTTLRCSRIYIYLDFHIYKPGKIRFLPPVEIENPTINFQTLVDCAVLSKGLNNKIMYGLNDLSEAKAQILDKDVYTWRDVPLDALSSEENRTVRFQLRWHN